MRKRKTVGEVLRERGATIVWTQFLSRCIDHKQGVAVRGQAGNIRGGTRYRGKLGARCILSLHVDGAQESGWSPERLTGEKRKAGSGWDVAPVVSRSVPSPAHVNDEVMRDPRPLTNWGQMGRGFFPTITLQQKTLEPVSSPLHSLSLLFYHTPYSYFRLTVKTS